MSSQKYLSVNLSQYINSPENTTCRVCLKKYESNELEGIFKTFEKTTIAQYITNFAQIPIAKEDCFSKVICKQCLNKLSDIRDFKKLIYNNNRCLNQFYGLYNQVMGQTAANSNKSTTNPKKVSLLLMPTTQNLVNDIKEIRSPELVTIKREVRDDDDDDNNGGEEDSKIDIVEHKLKNETIGSSSNKLEPGRGKIIIINNLPKVKKKRKKNPNIRFSCNRCDKVYKTKQGRDAHILTHTGRVYHQCDMCEKKFVAKYILKVHRRMHIEGNPFKCEECGKHFVSSHSLENHMELHTGNQKYQCEQCGKRFSHPVTLKSHRLSHTLQITEVKCQICNRTIRSRYPQALKIHMRTHLKDREKPCPTCGKIFKSSNGLNQHLKTHNDDLKIQCELCPKKYINKKNLKYHMASAHSTVRPFACEVCGKTFALKTGWYIHGRVHAKENPFTCKVCDKIFGYPSHLSGHMKTVHGILEATSSNE